MINISELGRQSPRWSWWQKLDSLQTPDIYLAENVADYLEDAPHIRWPRHKQFFCSPSPRAYIILHNVGLSVPEKLRELQDTHWFIMHDKTGRDLMYWDPEHPLCAAEHSYEEAREEQGLTEDDWVYEVFFRYFINYGFRHIVEVKKSHFSRRRHATDSLRERIRDFLPDSELFPQEV